MQCNQSLHYCRRKINEGRMRLSARIFGKWHIQPLDISIEPLTWQLLNQFSSPGTPNILSVHHTWQFNIEINHVRVVSANHFLVNKSFCWVIFSRETCWISIFPVHLSDLGTVLLFCTIWFCRPVMHNFFLERFAQASDWFEKRLAYTRSVATSSMVSHNDFIF